MNKKQFDDMFPLMGTLDKGDHAELVRMIPEGYYWRYPTEEELGILNRIESSFKPKRHSHSA